MWVKMVKQCHKPPIWEWFIPPIYVFFPECVFLSWICCATHLWICVPDGIYILHHVIGNSFVRSDGHASVKTYHKRLNAYSYTKKVYWWVSQYLPRVHSTASFIYRLKKMIRMFLSKSQIIFHCCLCTPFSRVLAWAPRFVWAAECWVVTCCGWVIMRH